MAIQACIPMPLQIVLDDVGWWSGADGHQHGEPFRTGMGRDHVPADYRAIADLGRQLGMRPQAAMVLCEWDRRNLLRHVPGSTWMGTSWDNRRWVGPWLDEAAAVFADAAGHIELTLHGIGHEYWEGAAFTRAEWYDRHRCMRPRAHVEAHLDAYAALLADNGLGDFPTSFVPAAFLYCYGDGELSPLLAARGITFASTPFSYMGRRAEPEHALMGLDTNVAWVDRGDVHIPWDRTAAPPPPAVPGPILGLHWPNILHQDPARNGEVVEHWVAQLEGVGRRFDRELARDTTACRTQLAFHLDGEALGGQEAVRLNVGRFAWRAAAPGRPVVTIKVAAPVRARFSSADLDILAARRQADHWVIQVALRPAQSTGLIQVLS